MANINYYNDTTTSIGIFDAFINKAFIMVKFIFNLIVSLFFGNKFTQNMSVVRLKERVCMEACFHH